MRHRPEFGVPNDQTRVVPTIPDLRAALLPLRSAGHRIAFVPTMGALHEGHLRLIDVAREHAAVVVVSIFVNPLQFGPSEDLAKYPRTLDADIAALRARGAAIVFTPGVEEMYPPGRQVSVTAAPHDAVFEGEIRPGHFTGVLTVVCKLFHIVQPDVAVFGQKDLQQLSLVRQMVRDLDIPAEIIGVPTVREPDGLAMSSRNRYLSPSDRLRAARINTALRAVQERYRNGEREAPALIAVGKSVLAEDPSLTVDYLALVNPTDFSPAREATPGTAIVTAVRIGGTRLLDNIIL